MVEATGSGPDLVVYCRRRDQTKRKGPVVRMMERRSARGRVEVAIVSAMLDRNELVLRDAAGEQEKFPIDQSEHRA